jgi:hypothetical protein
LEQQYRCRLQPHPDSKDGDRALLEGQLGKLRQGLARPIDSYAEGLLDEGEFEPRITPLRDRIRKLEQQIQRLTEEASLERGTSTRVASCRVGGKGEFRSPCRNVLETRWLNASIFDPGVLRLLSLPRPEDYLFAFLPPSGAHYAWTSPEWLTWGPPWLRSHGWTRPRAANWARRGIDPSGP